jgi:hypothetical protein
MGKGVFIGLESSERPVLRAYVRYYYIAVVHPGINWRVFQKVADVWYFWAYVCCIIHKV